MSITRQLIDACKRNDTRAQITLFELCYPRLMPVCKRYAGDVEAPEMLNLGFYKVLKGLRAYEFSEEIRFVQWAKRVLINAMIDEFRKQKSYKQRHLSLDHQMINGMSRQAVWNLADLRLDAEHIHRLIDELPGVTGKVFNMYVIDSYAHKEIAQMLEMSENTSRWYLAQARKILQVKLAAHAKQQAKVKS